MPPKSCFDRALGLLAARSHFRRELERKLLQRGYEEAEVEDVLSRLEAQGFLDDRRTAREYTAARLARGPEGRRRLEAELGRRGAPAEAIAEVLEEALPEDDRESAREAARGWLRRQRAGPLEPRRKAALARFLERKGFSPHAIFAVLEEQES